MRFTLHPSRFYPLVAARVGRAASRRVLAVAGLVLLSTLFALAALAFRVYYTGRPAYGFLMKDLFLAWVPLGLAIALVRAARDVWGERGNESSASRPSKRSVALLAVLTAVWVLFLPNAPYLLTEFVHLTPQHQVNFTRTLGPALLPFTRGVRSRPMPVWYDMLLILLFAWNGLLLALLSMRMVQQVVRQRFGAGWGWASAVLLVLLSGFGVTLGRFERFNSWDVFSKPGRLLPDVASRILNPLAHPHTSGATLLLSAFLLLAYLTMVTLMALGRESEA
jgi:uncharacterized membrane protein